MPSVTSSAARRPRAYVRVHGPEAVDYLNRMLSNDVPESGSVDALRAQLVRMRFSAKCEIEAEQHVSTIVLGGDEGIPNRDYGVPAVEVLDVDVDGQADLERLRIEAATPVFGREIDD